MAVVGNTRAPRVFLLPLQTPCPSQSICQRARPRENPARGIVFRVKLAQGFGKEAAGPARVVEIARPEFVHDAICVPERVIALLQSLYRAQRLDAGDEGAPLLFRFFRLEPAGGAAGGCLPPFRRRCHRVVAWDGGGNGCRSCHPRLRHRCRRWTSQRECAGAAPSDARTDCGSPGRICVRTAAPPARSAAAVVLGI